MEKSAVEFLERQLIKICLDIDKNVLKLIRKSIDQAKEMEKQQIIESIDETNSKWRSQKVEIILTGNHYYNQKFKNK